MNELAEKVAPEVYNRLSEKEYSEDRWKGSDPGGIRRDDPPPRKNRWRKDGDDKDQDGEDIYTSEIDI